MGITLLTGAVAESLTDAVAARIAEKLKGGARNIYFLVPQQFTHQAEESLLQTEAAASSGEDAEWALLRGGRLPGLWNVEVVSIRRLIHRILTENGAAQTALSPLGQGFVLRRAAEARKGSLKYLKNAVSRQGFLSECVKLIREFKEYDLKPDDISSAADTERIAELAVLYREYTRIVGDMPDETDLQNLAIDLIPKTGFLRGAQLYIDGIHRFAPQLRRMISALCFTCADVTMTALYGDDAALRLLRGIGLPVALEEVRPPGRPAPLAALSGALFGPPPAAYPRPAPQIMLNISQRPDQEAAFAANRIWQLVRGGMRYRDIALFCGDLAGYAPLLRREMSKCGIPIFLDDQRSILNNPLIETALCALSAADDQMRLHSVLRFFKAGLCGLSPEEEERLEEYARAAELNGPALFSSFRRLKDSFPLEELNQLRARAIAPLLKFCRAVRPDAPAREMIQRLYGLLEEIRAKEHLSEWIDALREDGHLEDAAECAQVWAVTMRLFDEAAELLKEARITPGEMMRALREGFDSARVHIIPSTADQVLTGSMTRSLSRPLKAVLVLGCAEGMIPSGCPQGGLLDWSDRARLYQRGVVVGPDMQSALAHEERQILQVFSLPSESLTVTASLTTPQGEPTTPSTLFRRIERMFPDRDERYPLLSTAEGSFGSLAMKLREAVSKSAPLEPFWGSVYRYYHHAQPERVRRLAGTLAFTGQIPPLTPELRARLYAAPVTSITRLEHFAKCPFLHFASDALRPALPRPYAPEAPDWGTLFHDALEKFVHEVMAQRVDWSRAAEIAPNIIAEILPGLVKSAREEIFLESPRTRALFYRGVRALNLTARALSEQISAGSFRPVGVEMELGEDGPRAPLDTEFGEILLRGRIDRIDRDGDLLRVIDYKSGAQDFSLAQVRSGLSLQLPLYLKAALRIWPGTRPAGMYILRIRDPILPGGKKESLIRQLRLSGVTLSDPEALARQDARFADYRDSIYIPARMKKDGAPARQETQVSEGEFAELLKGSQAQAAGLYHRMREGEVHPFPAEEHGETPCAYCRFRSLCGFDPRLPACRTRRIYEAESFTEEE